MAPEQRLAAFLVHCQLMAQRFGRGMAIVVADLIGVQGCGNLGGEAESCRASVPRQGSQSPWIVPALRLSSTT
jgi:hypothetical protein